MAGKTQFSAMYVAIAARVGGVNVIHHVVSTEKVRCPALISPRRVAIKATATRVLEMSAARAFHLYFFTSINYQSTTNAWRQGESKCAVSHLFRALLESYHQNAHV